jgi:glycosyltransferase involved in cell wall biosynthesis
MKKIIFVNRFFSPDVSATSQILSDLVFNLDVDEKELHVITSRMKYNDELAVLDAEEVCKGVYVHRCWTTRYGRAGLIGRSIDYLSFYASSFLKLLMITKKHDIVIAKTDPPLISVLCAVVAKLKNAVLINWIQDLFPEVAKELGVRLFQGIIYRVVKKIRNWSLNVAEYNVVLGSIMAEKINFEINSPAKTVVIPNWVVGNEMKPVGRNDNELRSEWGMHNKFVVGYSGNLGRAHDYKTILKAIEKLQNIKGLSFVFIGGGAGYEILKNEVDSLSLNNVVFKPYQPTELLSKSLSVPDVHLISLEPSLEGLIVPSKFYGIISVGRAILFIGDTDGEVARIVKKAECGSALPMNDSASLVSEIKSLYQNNDQLKRMSENAYQLYDEYYSKGKSVILWEKLLNSVVVH